MKHFTSFQDVDDLPGLLEDALAFKKNQFAYTGLGRKKTLGLIFLSASLRTRMSAQKAATNLGMNVMVMNIESEGWRLETQDGAVMDGRNIEHVKEAAAVIGEYCDIVGLRSYPSENGILEKKDVLLDQFVRYAGVPVMSLQSRILHPLQALADLITIKEFNKKKRPKIVLSWTPTVSPVSQAVPNSFLECMSQMEAEVIVAHPEGYELDSIYTKNSHIMNDQDAALMGADFVYARGWSSMKPSEIPHQLHESWMISPRKMAMTDHAKLMHPLPVRRNVEVSDAALDNDQCIVTEQAANRLYATQSVLKRLLESNFVIF